MSEVVSHLAETRARQALRASGLPFKGKLFPASSTHNEIHISQDHVVRVSTELTKRLKREATLYGFLPSVPWGPSLVATGNLGGPDYVIIERKPGQPLAHAWPFLSADRRRSSITDLARCLKELHATPAPSVKDVPELAESMYLLNTSSSQTAETDRLGARLAPLLDALSRLSADPNADVGVISAARDYITTNGHHFDDFDDGFLIHGDLTFENVLYEQQNISAVIDYEWCRGAPAETDLDVLLRCCAMPKVHVAAQFEDLTRAEDYTDIPSWLAEDYPELFSRPGLIERLTLLAIAFDVRDAMQRPLPALRFEVDDLHPYNRLISTVSSGGHVSLLLERAGLAV